MKNKYLLLFISVVTCVQAYAQTALLKGTIKDPKSKETLVGANVVIDNKTGVVSDINGNYKIPVSPGVHTVDYKMVGYVSQKQTIKVKAGDTLTININLVASATQLDQVVVSAGRFQQKIGDVTVSMEVIKPSLVENKNTTSMDDAIKQIPGVNVVDGQANIRGGSGFSYGAGSRVLVLVDDLPMLTADAGDVKWNFLPVENLQQIEVIKGASSVLYGSSALNGVINIRTAYPKDVPETKINMFSGVYMNPKRKELIWWGNVNPTYSGIDFFHSQKIKNFDLVIGGNLFNDDGYRQFENEERYRVNVNTRYRSKKHTGLSYGVNINSMYDAGGLFLLWQNADSGAYRPYGGSLSRYKDTRFNADPFITYFTSHGTRHSLRTRFYSTNNTDDTHQGSLANLYYAEYQFQKHFNKHFTLTSGLVGMYSTVNSDSLYGMHDGKNFAWYAQGDKKIKKLTLSFGVRGEYYQVDTAETKTTLKIGNTVNKIPFKPVVRAGMNYHIAKYTYLRASYGQGYRFPSVAEKFVSTTVDNLKIYPNYNLQPETGWSSEIGIKQGVRISHWNGYLDVAGFWTQYQNMMEFTFGYFVPPSIPNPGPFDMAEHAGFQSINVGDTRITGVDVTLTGTGKIGPIKTTVLAGYTYTDPIHLHYNPALDSTSSVTSPNILKYRFYHNAKADIQFDYKRWSMGFSMRYNSYMINIDKRFEESLFADILPNYKLYILPGLKQYREQHHNGNLIFDHRISYQVNEHTKIAIITNNIFNAEYMIRPGDIGKPRTIAIQATLKF